MKKYTLEKYSCETKLIFDTHAALMLLDDGNTHEKKPRRKIITCTKKIDIFIRFVTLSVRLRILVIAACMCSRCMSEHITSKVARFDVILYIDENALKTPNSLKMTRCLPLSLSLLSFNHTETHTHTHTPTIE